MNELIKITEQDGNQVVSARELHQKLEVKNHFTQWFDDNKNMFTENTDYVANKVYLKHENSIGGTWHIDYILILSCAKEMAMMSKVEKGKEIRQYFIACEQKLKQIITTNIALPKTHAEALRQLADNIERNEILEAEKKLLEPKADFYDTIIESKTTIDMAEVAKVLNLGYGRTTLFAKLKALNVLRQNREPYQQYVDNGWFKLVESRYIKDNKVCIGLKTVVFQKGVDGIRKLLTKRRPTMDELRENVIKFKIGK